MIGAGSSCRSRGSNSKSLSAVMTHNESRGMLTQSRRSDVNGSDAIKWA